MPKSAEPGIEILNLVNAIERRTTARMQRLLREAGLGLAAMEARTLRFVARHPGCTQNEIVRASGRDKAQIARIIKILRERELVDRPADGGGRRAQPLALFPEGTTGPGTHLLPFRSALLSAVAPAPPGVEVRPVAIDYGTAASEFGWFDEPGKTNVLRTLGRSRPVHVRLRILDPLPAMDDRKALTHAARDSIAEALAFGGGGANL